jgi:hypothetical protein
MMSPSSFIRDAAWVHRANMLMREIQVNGADDVMNA